MWIVSRVNFYGHWSFYRAYLLWNNKYTITTKKCDRKSSREEKKKTRKLSWKEFVWYGSECFFFPSDDNNWLRVVFYLHTFPTFSTSSNTIKIYTYFKNIYTNCLLHVRTKKFGISFFKGKKILQISNFHSTILLKIKSYRVHYSLFFFRSDKSISMATKNMKQVMV